MRFRVRCDAHPAFVNTLSDVEAELRGYTRRPVLAYLHATVNWTRRADLGFSAFEADASCGAANFR